jgi:hypothetical protein
MTLVQQDAPDLVRKYCKAKGLAIDSSTHTKQEERGKE